MSESVSAVSMEKVCVLGSSVNRIYWPARQDNSRGGFVKSTDPELCPPLPSCSHSTDFCKDAGKTVIKAVINGT